MFGFGGGGGRKRQQAQGNGGAKKPNAEDELLKSMMVDPATLLKGIEEDPSLLQELAELGGEDDPELRALLQAKGPGGKQNLEVSLSSAAAAVGKAAGGSSSGGGTTGNNSSNNNNKKAEPSLPAKAPAKPESAADAFLANLGASGDDMLDDMHADLGLVDEAGINFEAGDLEDDELLSELGGLGWTAEHEAAHQQQQQQQQQEQSVAAPPQGEVPPKGVVDAAAPAPVVTSPKAAAGKEGPAAAAPSAGNNDEAMADIHRQIAEARQRAVALKKEGKTEEAVQEVKRLRALEAELGVRDNLALASGLAKSLSIGHRSYEEEDDDGGGGGNDGEGEGPNGGADAAAVSTPALLPGAASSPGAAEGGAGAHLVGQQRVDQLKEEIAKKKAAAAAHHKAGHTEEALSFLREVKSLEQEVQRLQRRASSRSLLKRTGSSADEAAPVKTPASVVVKDAFTPLEEALGEARKQAVGEAARLKPVDPKAAVEAFKVAKEWEAKLAQLRERRSIPGAGPAPFQWTIRTRTYKKALEDVPLDKLELVVHEGAELLGPRRAGDKGDGARETVLVGWDLGFPKDSPHAGKTPPATTGPGATATFDFRALVDLPRTRSTEQAFARRHATFLVHHRRKGPLGIALPGLLTSEDGVAQCQVDLAPLLDHCEMARVELPLCRVGQRRPVGGHLTVSLRLRQPIKTSEMATEEIKTLVVGDWPEIAPVVVPSSTGPTAAAAAAAATAAASPAARAPSPSAAAAPKPPATQPGAGGNGGLDDPRFQELTDIEKNDPLNVSLLISNDVLEHEIQLLNTQNPDKLDENDRAIRDAELNMKLNLLVLRVQREEITIEQYMGMLTERIRRDQLLALYCSKAGKKPLALRVMKRIKIMQDELASATGAEGEG